MIYIASFHGGWTKLGYCSGCFYVRLDWGFEHNVHPEPDLCNRLKDCTLHYFYEGTRAEEEAIHDRLKAYLPHCGEFYAPGHLDEVVAGCSSLKRVPLPAPRPAQPTDPIRFRPCCLKDAEAHDGYQRDDHRRRAVATKSKKAPCSRCFKIISIRNDKLKNHQNSNNCTPVEPEPEP